jgi:hypothetical protein
MARSSENVVAAIAAPRKSVSVFSKVVSSARAIWVTIGLAAVRQRRGRWRNAVSKKSPARGTRAGQSALRLGAGQKLSALDTKTRRPHILFNKIAVMSIGTHLIRPNEKGGPKAALIAAKLHRRNHNSVTTALWNHNSVRSSNAAE